MSEGVTVTTNNVPRDVIDASQLTPKEREEFDYLNWEALEAGEDSASFVRYKGQLYDLGDTERWESSPREDWTKGWDGYRSDSFFSGTLFRWAGEDMDQMVLGTYYAS